MQIPLGIEFIFLGHNFWNTKARKAIKGSDDIDSSLVSNKNLSQKILSSGWCPELSKMGQNGLKPTSIVTSPTKNSNQKLFNF